MGAVSMNKKTLCLLLIIFIFSTSCANKKQAEQSEIEKITEENIEESKEVEPYTIIIDDEKKYRAKKSDPKELSELLNIKNFSSIIESEVKGLRPRAIEEAAQLVGIQTAMKWRYEKLLAEVEQYAYLLDTAFNFTPLLMVNDQETLVMPPIITKAENALRLENNNLLTTSKKVFEILETAKYITAIPNWRTYMMVNAFPNPEQPSKAVLPRNAKEIFLWQKTIREAWAKGILEADELFIVNINRLVRDYRGITLYHLLVAKDYVNEFSMSSSLPVTNIEGNKMFLEQKVFRITNPAKFQIPNK